MKLKSLYIAEKPSVAQEFGKALHEDLQRRDGYLESENSVVTWCVGHLVTMSYPDRYDEKFRRWSFETLPFLPDQFKYEIIPSAAKQFHIVKSLLNREDVSTIYVCTDSGREGEYIYRLVAMQAGIAGAKKQQKRVWIDSQTEEEILRGIREAKDLSEYDNLSSSAFLRAKEDYLMGINFSRALSLKYSYAVSGYLGKKYQPISVGRVMTCVLGMAVRREREIRHFVKQPFYRVLAKLSYEDAHVQGEWRVQEKSRYFHSPVLYKENGFREQEKAKELLAFLKDVDTVTVVKAEKKTEKKNPPLLYNLAELQNDCAKRFKISPDQTLQIAQELYEKKLCTYPRTDARVLSGAIAKEIGKNLKGLCSYEPCAKFARQILAEETWKTIAKTRYTDDKQITDHYAIIPTGQGIPTLGTLKPIVSAVYDLIVRRFLSVFYPPAVYKKIQLQTEAKQECFYSSVKILQQSGYLEVASYKKQEQEEAEQTEENQEAHSPELIKKLERLKKGSRLSLSELRIKEGETSPPKRYTSGSMILAMENAGQLIEDEELRAQIRGNGIGTSATRAEILKKLHTIHYLSLNKKTQVITPTQLGEMIYDVVNASIRSLLNPDLTASWEKGLNYVAEGSISEAEYMEKLNTFVARHTNQVQMQSNQLALKRSFDTVSSYYKTGGQKNIRKKDVRDRKKTEKA